MLAGLQPVGVDLQPFHGGPVPAQRLDVVVESGALEGERLDDDRPALARLTDHVVRGHGHPVEGDLVEGVVAHAGDLPDGDPGLGQRDEEQAEGVVLAAGQAQPVVGEPGEERVDLGAVQLVAALAVGNGAGGEDVEVGSGLGFAEQHAAEGGAGREPR